MYIAKTGPDNDHVIIDCQLHHVTNSVRHISNSLREHMWYSDHAVSAKRLKYIEYEVECTLVHVF